MKKNIRRNKRIDIQQKIHKVTYTEAIMQKDLHGEIYMDRNTQKDI